MNTIYVPKGKAKEYGDYALNIYTGCPHRCYYCFAPNVLHRDRETFHADVRPRDGIVEATRQRIEKDGITGKLIHLCFTCDPYPKGYDGTETREIIKLLKEYGNHVQILTKNGADAMRDFDLLDSEDWFGITHTGYTVAPTSPPRGEPNAGTLLDRLKALVVAKNKGVNTWVSCEPTIYPMGVFRLIETGDYIDLFKIGKLNYHPLDIDWAEFGKETERLCKVHNRNYYIKNSLRAEMERGDGGGFEGDGKRCHVQSV